MAKIGFNKLSCKFNNSIKTIDFNGENIEIKQYLPVQEKLALISKVIMASHEQDQNHANPVKVKIYTDLEVLFAYTNISFTEKQKEDTPKLYDLVFSSGLIDAVICAIPEAEYKYLLCGVNESIEAIYKYQNSVLGIMDALQNNYSNLALDAEQLQRGMEQVTEMPIIQELISLT